jgi:ABC-2 type transport system permease protein
MSNTTIQTSDKKVASKQRAKPSGRALPAWWLVLIRELTDLWVGGKALNLMLIYSVIMGVMVYVYSSNSELSLIPPKETVYETLKNAMAISLFIGLIIGADSISGERDRATLESLLLTPAKRRQIIVGKFLAGISQWPVAFVIAMPFMNLLSQGDEILLPAFFWGAITGTALIIGYTGLGMLVSYWSASNKTSYFISMGLYIFFLVPAQLPGRAQTGVTGQFLQWVNPLAAVNHFLSKHLVNYEPISVFWTWLIPPAVFALLVMGSLFFAGSGLRLEAGGPSWPWLKKLGGMMGLSVVVLMILALSVFPVMAGSQAGTQSGDLQITIDQDAIVVKTSDKVEYNTVVTNNGSEKSPPLIVAMNIINLDAKGDTVDPEDWSPKRTQYIESLAAGESVSLNWIINTILDGNYMIYMVLIPTPGNSDSTSQPVATSGIHLTVTPFTRLNPRGVLPYTIGVPILLVVLIYFVYRRRNQQIDMGGSS